MFQIENKLCVILDESKRNKKNSALRDMLAWSTRLKSDPEKNVWRKQKTRKYDKTRFVIPLSNLYR